MRIHFDFDLETAIEVIFYLAQRLIKTQTNDIYHLSKVLYFADKSHLEDYGRFICGETYVAMNNGPVPIGIDKLLQAAKAPKQPNLSPMEREFVDNLRTVEDWVIPFREPNLDLLSKSERQCLDQAIENYGTRSFSELRELSHDAAYHATALNDVIKVEAIVATLRDGQDLLNYLRNPYPG